jgi:hypothetical protein
MNTPVAILVFNRPDLTRRVFDVVAAQRPPTLLVVADGPRAQRDGEAQRCAQVRAIFDKIDWPCDFRTNFASENLGCRRRVSSGLDWVFQQVDRAIILEDDCLPHPTFFPFCHELLERYRDEPKVMHITGDNFQPPGWTCPDSYYFSRYASIWGWATWRRAWKLYDVNINRWSEMKSSNWLSTYLTNPREVEFWSHSFDSVHSKGFDTWDHQWTFACMTNNSIGATPAVNLIENIGFGPEATHTLSAGPAANHPSQPLSFPLRHPGKLVTSATEDDFIFSHFMEHHPPTAATKLQKSRQVAGRILRKIGVRR